jgi:hypothetical protein
VVVAIPQQGRVVVSTSILSAAAGNIVGKALFEGILLNLALAPFFTRGALQGRRLTLDDLASLDPQLYRCVWACV